jgi:hypothetical protein
MMKAVWRLHAGKPAVGCERLRPTAPSRRNLSTQDARQSGFLTESREVSTYPEQCECEGQLPAIYEMASQMYAVSTTS